MRTSQNGPLDKSARFLFMRFSVSCVVVYGAIKKLCDTNLCDQTRIIRINKTRAEKCFTVSYFLQINLSFILYYALKRTRQSWQLRVHGARC